LTDGDLFSDEVKINLHMLGTLVLNGVVGEVHGTYVVAVDERTPGRKRLEFQQQLAQPVASATPLAMVWYSASALERETTVCRLADQDTKLSSRNTA
jgi:hypothetical protein